MNEDDEFLYGPEGTQEPEEPTTTVIEAKDGQDITPASASESESESESDSDVEFIISTAEPVKPKVEASTVSPDAAIEVGKSKQESNEPAAPPDQTGTGLEVDKVAEFDGKPLTQLKLSDLKDKPWRLPGSDVKDYFNYGFDEFSWSYYCSKQDKLRGEFDAKKLMAEISKSSAGMMPPMMGMPGMMPPMMGMPPMPNNFFQQQQNSSLPKMPTKPAAQLRSSSNTPVSQPLPPPSRRDEADRDFELRRDSQMNYRDRANSGRPAPRGAVRKRR